ncbi:hypothetical protein BpHYR1_033276 [Brachionus plicatilis]|uniref:Uncharacterized protein n=1 Tax=Brachionus plicatilis TaxID=10195 RepID=A0A3M7QZR6_BRAPC|nr:hypothetical protein BpHYR1_033276 [Brachionus plicatilis]
MCNICCFTVSRILQNCTSLQTSAHRETTIFKNKNASLIQLNNLNYYKNNLELRFFILINKENVRMRFLIYKFILMLIYKNGNDRYNMASLHLIGHGKTVSLFLQHPTHPKKHPFSRLVGHGSPPNT